MKYLNGKVAKLGDLLDLGGGMTGEVVCIFEDKFFSDDFPEVAWAALKTGMMVKSNQAGLVHYPKPVIDLVLIRRAINPRRLR